MVLTHIISAVFILQWPLARQLAEPHGTAQFSLTRLVWVSWWFAQVINKSTEITQCRPYHGRGAPSGFAGSERGRASASGTLKPKTLQG